MSDVVRATFKEMALLHGNLRKCTFLVLSSRFFSSGYRSVSLRSVPMDLSLYADDVDLVQVRPTPTPIAGRVNFSNDVFTSVLTKRWQAGSHAMLQRSAQLSRVSGEGPYLSSLFCLVGRREFTRIWECSISSTGQTRQRFRHPAGQAKPMLNVFRALVFNALASGMEILVLSPAEVPLCRPLSVILSG